MRLAVVIEATLQAEQSAFPPNSSLARGSVDVLTRGRPRRRARESATGTASFPGLPVDLCISRPQNLSNSLLQLIGSHLSPLSKRVVASSFTRPPSRPDHGLNVTITGSECVHRFALYLCTANRFPLLVLSRPRSTAACANLPVV